MNLNKLLFLTLPLLGLLACDNSPQQVQPDIDMPAVRHAQVKADATTQLEKFINASIRRQHDDYYNLITSQDQAIKTRAQYLDEQTRLQPNLADAYFEKISYVISALDITGTTAKAEVVYQFPDAERMIKKVYNLAILDIKSLPPLDEMKQKIDQTYQGKLIPMKAVTRHFNLLRESTGWRVAVGWNKKS